MTQRMINNISNTFRPLREVRRVFLLAMLVMGALPMWAGQEQYNGKTYNVVYLSSTGSGNGDSRETPVNTWAKAYKKLTNTGNRDYDWEHNIIVIVGSMQINYKEAATMDKSSKQGTAATITGVWPWDVNDKATTTQIKDGGQAKIAGIDNNIGADVRFRNLRIQGDEGLQDRISLRLHSTCFDEGLVMMGFAELGTGYGMTEGRSAPALHIQFSFDQISGSAVRPTDVVYEMPDNKEMTITFKSGKYGRVAGSRTQGNLVTTNYIQGTPEHPIMAHIIVDMQEGNDNTGNYADDFGILMGGSSQGFVCADLQFDLKHGTIATMVAGTQGNNVAACVTNKIPAESFAGRTKVNIGVEGGDDDDFTIQTYYGGTQGRATTSGSNASAYFYGESEFNLYSGTIKAGVFSSATAFSGLRYENDHNKHTPDYAIPYVDDSNNLTFGAYNESGNMGIVKSSFNGYIDLSETKITLNIYGGVIEGGVYGGSRGYDSQVTTQYAPDNCGTHFGNTYVNIYGGTIKGGVYGGGLGTTEYYESQQKEGFLTVAQVYGNTNVKIYGGDIRGYIYGGGSGVGSTSNNEYLKVAKVFGSTNVTIDPQTLKPRAEWADPNVPEFVGSNPDWTFTGNIYGGGAKGTVEGNTNVTILGGTIIGNVYGAGEGEEGHPDKAKVTGTTKVIIGE